MTDRQTDTLIALAAIEEKMSQMSTTLNKVQETIDTLHNTLHIGNGQPPLMQRVFMLEKTSDMMTKAFESAIFDLKKATQEAQVRTAKESGAILVAIIATIGSITTAIFSAKS
jgi:hypothetical protein